MKKRNIIVKLIIAFGAVVGAAIFILRPEYSAVMQHGTADERVAFFTELLAVATTVLAFVSVSQIFFFIKQDERLIDSIKEAKKATVAATRSADAATKSATISETSMRMQLRCYIATALNSPYPDVKGGLEVIDIQDDILNVKVLFYVKNNGQTPAYDVKSSVFFDVGAPSPHDRLSASSQVDVTAQSRATVNPGEAISVQRKFQGHVNPTQIGEVKTGRQQFYVYGQIKFTDAFQEARWIRFQYFIVHSPGQDGDIYRNWEISEEGNYTSENANRIASVGGDQ